MVLDYIFYRQDICHVCKDTITEDYICSDCLDKLDFIDGDFELTKGRVYYPLFYNNMIKSIIKKFKFEKMTYLVKPLGLILYEYVKTKPELMEVDYLTYISMDPISEFDRGYNQAELLCRELAKYMGKEVILLVKKIKKTKEQNKLDIGQRKKNLRQDNFKPVSGLKIDGKKILLLDDLVTTGATLEVVTSSIEKEYNLDLRYLTLSSSRIGEEDD